MQHGSCNAFVELKTKIKMGSCYLQFIMRYLLLSIRYGEVPYHYAGNILQKNSWKDA